MGEREEKRRQTHRRREIVTELTLNIHAVQPFHDKPKLGAQNVPSARVLVPVCLSEPEHLIPSHMFKESHFGINLACIKKKPTLLSVAQLYKE